MNTDHTRTHRAEREKELATLKAEREAEEARNPSLPPPPAEQAPLAPGKDIFNEHTR